jgi:signal transduction histidine kinase
MPSEAHADIAVQLPAKKREVLLVVDDPHTLQTMESALSGKGYQVTTASNASDAIEWVDARCFDLVILGLSGGVKDGLAALAKAREKNSNVRNVVLAEADIDESFDVLRFSDVDDYIWKPCSPPELADRVNHCLRRQEFQVDKVQPEDRLLEMNKEILQILTMMSHDIRGSLISIGAGLKLLNRGIYGRMDEGAAHKTMDLYERVRSLVGLAEDYLGKAFSLTEEIESKEETVNLKRDVVCPVLEELSSEMRDYGILLNNHLDSIATDRLSVKANPVWLRAVFRNLFKNAIKYGGHGCTIGIGFEERDSYYRLSVYNSGLPIPEESRGKLFTKFTQLSNKSNGSNGGVGLGLYMIKEIVRKHGGDIWYEAEENRSNFVFTLPQK